MIVSFVLSLTRAAAKSQSEVRVISIWVDITIYSCFSDSASGFMGMAAVVKLTIRNQGSDFFKIRIKLLAFDVP